MQATPSLQTIFQCAQAHHVKFGSLLEIGPGSLWPGLHYVAKHPDLELIGVGYSSQEREAAQQHARKLQVSSRVRYLDKAGERLPLEDKSVDAVISYGSLHQWSRPLAMLDEMARVLKWGGKFFVGNVRRDASWLSTFWFGLRNPGLKAMYETRPQTLDSQAFKHLLEMSRLTEWSVSTIGPDVWAVSK
jgi:ubiquinone/menaquinone biosynthesis C-methylase UbiE